jgi:hypothetical protein
MTAIPPDVGVERTNLRPPKTGSGERVEFAGGGKLYDLELT